MELDLLQSLQTPCIVVDNAKAKKNISNMQQHALKAKCNLRPHIKTHKMVAFAKMQIEAGAVGITCAKISEAMVMADGGIDDIFIAYPIIGKAKTDKLPSLASKVKRLILAVDSIEGALGLQQCAKDNNLTFEVRLEIDTGAKRTGVQKDIVLLAKTISEMPNLNLTGIFTFKSLIYDNKPTTDPKIAAIEEGQLMESVANLLIENGINIKDISAGSSPTGVLVAQTGKVNEIRPGTYIFNDYMLYKEGIVKLDDIALSIYATVVSTPCTSYAVIDGGSKTFPTDVVPNLPPYYYEGFAHVLGNKNLKLTRLSEEHGILTADDGYTNLKVGDIVRLIPIHVCPAVNLQNNVYILEYNTLTLVKVDARGSVI